MRISDWSSGVSSSELPRCPISGRLGPILAKGRFSPLVAGARPSSMKPIRKAVFPVAGLGTRFLPATNAIPQEMLPVVDRPLIPYAVDAASEERSGERRVGKTGGRTGRSRGGQR